MSQTLVFASKALAGNEYLWVKQDKSIGARTLVDKVLPDGKAVVRFFVPGYGFKTQSHTVPATQMLKPVEAKEEGKPMPKKIEKPAKKAAKPAKALKAPRVKLEPKEPKVTLERMPKAKPGELEKKELGGVMYRFTYRARSNAQRVKDCEQAKGDHCGCRCQGALHGKSHAKFIAAENALFERAAAKHGRSYVTAEETHALVKLFGGPVVHKPKPRGRKPSKKPAKKK